ncbi:hypothetical protein KRP22_004822 [Phytophthora ramorum]|nr:hypothetical protein KRP22_10454 [Phytophthora ramorum]
MGKERFQSNPYPGLVLSKEDHALLLDLTNTLVQQNFEKYQHFVQHDKRRIDLDRWKLVKSRNDIHIHVRREDPEELQAYGPSKLLHASSLATSSSFSDSYSDHSWPL